jgi:two-component system sensor histidine kinase/response regulator
MNGRPRIVIIDDEIVVRDSCRDILAGGDYQIATAPNGTEGLQLVREFQPDLVYVDLKMPGIPGLEVLREIQAYDSTIVTVVITGFATVSSAVDAMKFGAYDYLPKPFTPDEYRLITNRALEKRKLVLETISLRREKEMLRENFAAIVSHELKSPLSAVQQNLYVLIAQLHDVLNEEQRLRLERMKARITDLVELIHTWLRVIEVDIESIKDNFKPLSMASVIAAALDTVEPEAVRKDIDLVKVIEEPLRAVYGDEGTLTEVLVNVCMNAIKYSYPDSKVTISARSVEDQVEVTVTDVGVGIANEDLPYVFEDYYRGTAGVSGEKGHGLGLALCRRIIETHQGTISVESEPGKGSTFVIRLPAHDDTESSPTPQTKGAVGVISKELSYE